MVTVDQNSPVLHLPLDPQVTPGDAPPVEGASLFRRIAPAATCLVIYLVLATVLYSGSSWLSNTRITGCACGDQAQMVWFIAWPAYALTHGHNLFYSSWVNYPAGMNMTVNTSVPLLGVLGTPITLLLGPVATYNVLLRLGFALSAFSLCLVLRRWTGWWPASFVGGLTYGFSAYMVGQGLGHLALVFVPLPPLMFFVLHEMVVRRTWPVWKSGGALGLLASAQFLISSEVLLLTAVAGAVALAMAAIARHREIRAAFSHVVKALAWAAGVTVLLIAYPAWVGVYGPQHVVGPPHPVADLALYPGDLLGTVVPTELLRMAPDHLIRIGSSLTGGALSENGIYLGVPLLITYFGFLIAFRRRSILLLAGALGIAMWVLSLGPHLTIDRHVTKIPLPFNLFLHIPFAQDMLAVRFSLLTALFTSAVLAIGLDMLRQRIGVCYRTRTVDSRRHTHRTPSRVNWLGSAAALLIAVVVTVSLLPRSSYATASTGIPPFFSGDAVQRIPTGSTVLTYPYPAADQLQGMLDQAVADMRFKITGGYVFVPDATGHSTFGPQVLPPAQVQQLFYSAFQGGEYRARFLPPLASTVPAIRTYLARYNVSSVIYYDVGADPGLVMRYMTAAIGPPTDDHGTTGWFDVATRLHPTGPTVGH